jgi:hypothetical protein
MGSAIQAGGPAISRCRNRELNTAGPGTAEEGARALAGWSARPVRVIGPIPKLIVRVRYIPGSAPRSPGPVPAKARAQIVAAPANMR